MHCQFHPSSEPWKSNRDCLWSPRRHTAVIHRCMLVLSPLSRNLPIIEEFNKANLRDLIAATSLVISNWIQIIDFSARMTLKFDGWHHKTIEHLFYTKSSVVHHFKSMSQFKLELQSGHAQLGSKLMIFCPCDLEIWRVTLKNIRAPLLYCIKLCASFQSHGWIQTWVTVRKRSIRVKIGNFCAAWPWNLMNDLENW